MSQPPAPRSRQRRRITAPDTGHGPVRADRIRPGGAAGTADPAAIYLRTLIRAQLRIGIACCLGLVVSMSVAAVVIATTPALHQSYVAGVPWSWVLQAYGMYPLIAVFALVYVRSAARNEARYRSLAESG